MIGRDPPGAASRGGRTWCPARGGSRALRGVFGGNAVNRRRQIRELAFKLLFQVDVGKQPLSDVAASFREVAPRDRVDERMVEAVIRLSELAMEHLAEVDEMIRGAAEKWPLERLAAVDRNIMRLATAEMLHGRDVPPSVAINEAVELAKKYGTEDSGRFVNGVLGALARRYCDEGDAQKPPAVPVPPNEE
ncbi:MAG: transcription antitermination factor NusB [Armatimonadetes bacterium]|nr:transcription antitermination factor NusB [Armatimonadota bacterium]